MHEFTDLLAGQRGSKTIKEYLKSCHGVVRALLHTSLGRSHYGDHARYATNDSKMITRMLYLSPDKNKLLVERSARSVKKYTVEYKIDNRTVYNKVDQICKQIDLYPYVKQYKSKRDSRGAFYAIHSR